MLMHTDDFLPRRTDSHDSEIARSRVYRRLAAPSKNGGSVTENLYREQYCLLTAWLKRKRGAQSEFDEGSGGNAQLFAFRDRGSAQAHARANQRAFFSIVTVDCRTDGGPQQRF